MYLHSTVIVVVLTASICDNVRGKMARSLLRENVCCKNVGECGNGEHTNTVKRATPVAYFKVREWG